MLCDLTTRNPKRKIDDVERGRKTCSTSGCGVLATFGYLLDDKPLYVSCDKHRSDDMMNLRRKRCEHENCIEFATHGNRYNERRKYCASHMEPGMLPANRNYCRIPECRVSFSKKSGLIFCEEHSDNRICSYSKCKIGTPDTLCDLHKPKYCVEPDCITYAGESGRCSYHAGFLGKPPVSEKNRKYICRFKDCYEKAAYGLDHRKYCETHKKSNMRRFHLYICASIFCEVYASYYEGEYRTYCEKHAKPGSHKVARKCEDEICKLEANFGYSPETIRFCARHKHPHMKLFMRK